MNLIDASTVVNISSIDYISLTISNYYTAFLTPLGYTWMSGCENRNRNSILDLLMMSYYYLGDGNNDNRNDLNGSDVAVSVSVVSVSLENYDIDDSDMLI